MNARLKNKTKKRELRRKWKECRKDWKDWKVRRYDRIKRGWKMRVKKKERIMQRKKKRSEIEVKTIDEPPLAGTWFKIEI